MEPIFFPNSFGGQTLVDVHRFLSWIQFQVLHRNQLRLFSMSSRRTPCGRTPLTESGLAFSVVRPLQTVEYMRPAFDMRLKE